MRIIITISYSDPLSVSNVDIAIASDLTYLSNPTTASASYQNQAHTHGPAEARWDGIGTVTSSHTRE